jgi:phosphoglucomutase
VKARARIRFGTSGWRGVLGEDFHFAGARAIAAALARHVGAPATRPRVLVAHDTRFLGERLAEQAAAALAGAGARPVLCAGPTPTPVVNRALGVRRAAAALVFTASHNPAPYQGLKLLLPWGGSAPDTVTRRIAAEAERWLARAEPPLGPVPSQRASVIPAYLTALERALGPAPKGRAPTVSYDALHGCGAGVLDAALAGRGCRVRLLHGERDPDFGGAAPDPTPARIAELARLVRRGRGLRLGLATDGDADRLAAVDAGGRLRLETELLALLVDHPRARNAPRAASGSRSPRARWWSAWPVTTGSSACGGPSASST